MTVYENRPGMSNSPKFDLTQFLITIWCGMVIIQSDVNCLRTSYLAVT